MKLDNQILLLEKLTGKKVVLESPDTTMQTFDGRRTVGESDAVPFGMVGDEMFVGKLGRVHNEIKYIPEEKEFPLEIRKKYKRAGRGMEDYDYPGRVWMIGPYVSFYDYPKTQSKLIEILTKLQEELKTVHNIDINLTNKAYIEVYVDRLDGRLVHPRNRDEYTGSALIKASDYDACIQGKARFQKTQFSK